MGGANVNMTAVSKSMAVYDPDAVQGSVLDVAEIERQIEMYRTRSADERRSITGEAANEALGGELGDGRMAEVTETLRLCERVLRRRRALG